MTTAGTDSTWPQSASSRSGPSCWLMVDLIQIDYFLAHLVAAGIVYLAALYMEAGTQLMQIIESSWA